MKPVDAGVKGLKPIPMKYRFSPSSIGRSLTCTAAEAFALKLKIPKPPTSPAAAEGILLHDAISGYFDPKINDISPDAKLTMTNDQIELVKETYNRFRSFLQFEFFDRPVSWIANEKFIRHPKLPLHGRVDLVARESNDLLIVDWKFGRGVAVNKESDHLQLKAYASLVMSMLDGEPEAIRTIIVQPNQPIGHYRWTPKEIHATEAQIKAAWSAYRKADYVFAPTESNCRWCRARQVCPALGHQANTEAAKLFIKEDEYALISIVPDQVAAFLKKADLIASVADDLKKIIVERMQAGSEYPGVKYQQGRKMMRWNDDAEPKLKQIFPDNRHIKSELKSPAAMKRELDAKQFAQIEAFTSIMRSRGSIRLTGDHKTQSEAANSVAVLDFQKALTTRGK